MNSILNLDYYHGKDLYSDGAIEKELLEIVENRENDIDRILFERKNWALTYHLSPKRWHLLDWYDFGGKDVLEIGSGCGALTGLLCKGGKKVVSVDLSLRRSKINEARNSKFSNLEIIVGNFADVNFKNKFDVLTLIGVLEYSGKFIDEPDPFSFFLKSTKDCLKNGGELILAIENAYGLKYWAGSREDHTGKFFDGITGYRNSSGIKTFGRLELEEMLLNVGFSVVDFYYPYPDYKLPYIIHSDLSLPKESTWAKSNVLNFDQSRHVSFSEKDALDGIIKNEVYPFFANSFLIVAKV